jgi:hypothetical protein
MFGFIFKNRLDKAIRLAEAAHKKTGDRYYVLPYKFDLQVFNKNDFFEYRRRDLIPKKNKMGNVISSCFYYTGSKFGNKPSTMFLEKKKEEGLKIMEEYYRYYLSCLFLNWCKKYKFTSYLVSTLSSR